MFPKNKWYVAAWDLEVQDQPVARTLCGEPVVLFRDSKGHVVAMEDACPHRLLPLSMGFVEGDAIRCRYHGLLLGSDGICRAMPGNEPVNFGVKAKTYPVIERYRFIWVWIGDPKSQDEADLPNLWMNEHPQWRADGGTFHVKCDYRLVIDNLMDLTHETYVHASSIGQKELHDYPIETQIRDGEVITQRWIPGVEPAPMYKAQLTELLGKEPGLVDRWQICRFTPPGSVIIDVGVIPIGMGASLEQHDQGGIRVFVLDFITPETENTCHYFWGAARQGNLEDHDAFAKLAALQREVFLEDVEVLEAQQRNLDAFPDRKLRAYSIDSGGIRARMLLDRLNREQAPAPQ